MRVGCLQFSPQVGDVDNNLNRADSILNRCKTEELEDLDLLVLPEMAFTGYHFQSLREILPFLEPQGSGISALWARTTALKYDCKVAVGYPEKVDVSGDWPTSPQYYNSLLMVNEEGETILNYRKSFLYYTDEPWALEGPGFFAGEIEGLGQTSVGICMDINPYKFESPFHTFEFAFHVIESESNLVVVSMAWNSLEEKDAFWSEAGEPDMSTLGYWVQRLEPLIRAEMEGEIIVVLANRCGMEGETLYAGTSAVLGIADGVVNLYGMLARGAKELLIVDTDDEPYARLVTRGPRAGGQEEVKEAAAAPAVGAPERVAQEPPQREMEEEEYANGYESDESPVTTSADCLGWMSDVAPAPASKAQTGEAMLPPPPPAPAPASPRRNKRNSYGSMEVDNSSAIAPEIPVVSPSSSFAARPRLTVSTDTASPISPIKAPPQPLSLNGTNINSSNMPPPVGRGMFTPPLSGGMDGRIATAMDAPASKAAQTPIGGLYTPEEPQWPLQSPLQSGPSPSRSSVGVIGEIKGEVVMGDASYPPSSPFRGELTEMVGLAS